MKKNILKSIVFILILAIILRIISYIFIPKNNSKEYGMEEPEALGILGERENSIDVIFYGDSEPMASIIPMQIWQDYGITTYVCANAGQTLPDTCQMVYETLKKQKPKVVILEANNSYIPSSVTVDMARVANVLFPITEYHNRWKSLNSEDFFGPINYRETEVNRGYYYVGAVAPADDKDYMTYSDDVEEIPTINKLHIKLIKAYVEAQGAKFMMVSVPNINNWNYARHNAMTAFTEQEGIDFLDLNYMKDEVKIDWQKETGDIGEHVNFWGALKVTTHIGKWLNDTELFANHQEDSEYNNWNKDLVLFKEKYGELYYKP